ncbi:hypothetical protein SAMN05421741_10747 [Paenimyroides ummariense]|uniref:Import component protein n=1 Tax=Paenimyroides ummariense TaxID=913024 RepID=A0A1I5A0B4_9FLAO|nr:import component protein [Paenimyroides ummariense]SFN55813.1 hypothetical protein SAMN05421741_10747 [Paenimyroides ummariense]
MTPKVQSILSYLGILWLIAFFVGKDQRNDLSKYHLKQGLGLFITAVVFNLCAGVLLTIVPSFTFVLTIVGFVFLILMVLGIITAANEVKKPVPVIGKFFEDKFNFIM